jgi:hypothetical protein
MVIDPNGKRLRQVWHAQDFAGWMEHPAIHSLRVTGDRFTFSHRKAVALNEVADKNVWIVSSHVPGKVWTDPLSPPVQLSR